MPKPTANDAETSITLTNDEWSKVLHCMILISRLPAADPMRVDGLAETGRKLAEQCPKGSAPWFGAAGLQGD